MCGEACLCLGVKKHPFVGRHDRDCEQCGLPDRAPVHKNDDLDLGYTNRVKEFGPLPVFVAGALDGAKTGA